MEEEVKMLKLEKAYISAEEFDLIVKAFGTEESMSLDKFEACEHKNIGDRALNFLLLSDEDKIKNDEMKGISPFIKEEINDLASDEVKSLLTNLQKNGFYNAKRWISSNNIKLSSGDIVALAGDFFGLPDQPISMASEEDRCNVFEQAYDSLCGDNADAKEINELRKLFAKEVDAIRIAINKGEQPGEGLHNIASKQNIRYAKLTKISIFPGMLLNSRYIKLANNNFDHFGKQAEDAYAVGHTVALKSATQAQKYLLKKDTASQKKGYEFLATAIKQELFACHFLTDIFASGHMRTPRKAIYDHVMATGWTPGKSYIAGLLAKAMHDEDNEKGLLVENKKGHQWKAKGDACYFEPGHVHNRDHVTGIVVAGLASIMMTALGKKNTYDFTQLIPSPRDGDPTNPLFKVDEEEEVGQRLKIRSFSQDNSNNYNDVSSPIKALCQARTKLHSASAEDKKLTVKEIEEVEKQLEQMVELDELTIESSEGEKHTCTIL